MMKSRVILFAILLAACAGMLAALWHRNHNAAAQQRKFSSAQAAARALVLAAQNDDTSALLRLFGPEGKEIVVSGDPIRDRSQRAAFVARAKQSMSVEISPSSPDRALVLIGEDQFPFPVPIVRSRGRWRFDTSQGKQELVARRIGSNELDAIELCRKFVDAQYRFAAEDQDNSGARQYAQRFISSSGKRDGLYWPADARESVGPIAELVVEATEEGYEAGGQKAVPYHGYLFRFLTGQGPNAPGGSYDYMVHGLMIGGFGLVAWPAEYRASGIKTFLVNQSGIVLERDLGEATAAKAEAMKVFNPDTSWDTVQ